MKLLRDSPDEPIEIPPINRQWPSRIGVLLPTVPIKESQLQYIRHPILRMKLAHHSAATISNNVHMSFTDSLSMDPWPSLSQAIHLPAFSTAPNSIAILRGPILLFKCVTFCEDRWCATVWWRIAGRGEYLGRRWLGR